MAVAEDARRVVRDVLRNLPIVSATTLEDQVNASIVPERLIGTLSGLFGMLVAAGIYGVLSYTVSRRIGKSVCARRWALHGAM